MSTIEHKQNEKKSRKKSEEDRELIDLEKSSVSFLVFLKKNFIDSNYLAK